jgi:hypothetical protein
VFVCVHSPIDPLAVVISLCGWLMTPYGWLAG